MTNPSADNFNFQDLWEGSGQSYKLQDPNYYDRDNDNNDDTMFLNPWETVINDLRHPQPVEDDNLHEMFRRPSPTHSPYDEQSSIAEVDDGITRDASYAPTESSPRPESSEQNEAEGSALVPLSQAYVEVDLSNEHLPYSQLLHLCLLHAQDHEMTLGNIYLWFQEVTKKHVHPGWKNSVRHNLSMNKAFERHVRDRESFWSLAEKFISFEVEPTTRYRNEKGGARSRRRRAAATTTTVPPGPQRQSAGSRGGRATSRLAKVKYRASKKRDTARCGAAPTTSMWHYHSQAPAPAPELELTNIPSHTPDNASWIGQTSTSPEIQDEPQDEMFNDAQAMELFGLGAFAGDYEYDQFIKHDGSGTSNMMSNQLDCASIYPDFDDVNDGDAASPYCFTKKTVSNAGPGQSVGLDTRMLLDTEEDHNGPVW